MKDGLPVILVSGSNFVAKKLVASLMGDSVMIVIVGEDQNWVEYSGKNISIVSDITNLEYRSDYVFDFEGNQKIWSRAEVDESRLVVISIDKIDEEYEEKLKKRSVDWRHLVGYDIYGEGMEMNENWVSRVMETAVTNKNLEIPKENGDLRCIYVDDFVEVIKKTCFVPGLSGERVKIFGKRVGIDTICRTLVNKAKMTKKGAVVKNRQILEIDDEEVEGEWRKIGWDGGGGFEVGIEESLQYLFSEIDLILRGKKKKKEIVKKRTPRMRVEIEEDGEIEKKKEIVVEKKVEIEIDNEIDDEDDMNDVVVGKTLKKPKENIYEKYEWKPKFEVKENKKSEEIKPKEDKDEDKIDLTEFKIKPAVDFGLKKKEIKIEKPIKTTKIRFGKIKINKINWKMVILPLMIIVSLYVTVLISFFGSLWRVARATDKVKIMVENGQVSESSDLIDKNLVRVASLEERLRLVSMEGRMFSYKGWGEVLRVLETTLELEKELLGFFVDSDKYSKAIFEGETINWKEEEIKMKASLAVLENRLGLLEARMKGDWSFLPNRIKSFVFEKSEDVGMWRELIARIREGLDSFLYIMATDGGRRDFLVIMQNEMELRPTGGFIGSFGVLSFEDGQFLNLEVSDIYDIDGQLKGHVEPPAPIREVLGEASWYLRDANWKADFVEASTDMEWFFKKETGREVDGIISINLSVAKAILEHLGEVWVPDFNENINSNNLFDQAEFYSEKAFFAGSRQKSTFLGKLAGQLMEEIKAQKGMAQIGLVKSLLTSLDKNEIQIYVDDKKQALNLADLGWDGSMYSGGCGMENCVADYFFAVEANLGVNKSNYFLKRSIDRTVDISDRAVTRVVKIAYENMARTTAWPGGDYKNYMRVYVPTDVNIAEVSIYDSDDTTNRKVLSGDDLKVKTIGDKKELAFLVTVPVTKKRTVEIRYSSQIDLNTASNFSYLSYTQKQSGYGDTPIVSLVSYPSAWQAIQVEPVATVVNGKLLFSQNFDRDLSVGVVIEK